MIAKEPPKDGLCRGKTHLFFQPPSRTRAILQMEREAISLCNACPSLDQCRDYALRYEIYGIWGGMTERQRRAMRKEMKITCTPHHTGDIGAKPC